MEVIVNSEEVGNEWCSFCKDSKVFDPIYYIGADADIGPKPTGDAQN